MKTILEPIIGPPPFFGPVLKREIHKMTISRWRATIITCTPDKIQEFIGICPSTQDSPEQSAESSPSVGDKRPYALVASTSRAPVSKLPSNYIRCSNNKCMSFFKKMSRKKYVEKDWIRCTVCQSPHYYCPNCLGGFLDHTSDSPKIL